MPELTKSVVAPLLRMAGVLGCLFLGAWVFHWLLLAFYERGVIQNEVAVAVLPFNSFVANLAFFFLLKWSGFTRRQAFALWIGLMFCGGLLQLVFRAGLPAFLILAAGTLPSVLAYWAAYRKGQDPVSPDATA